MPRDRLGLKDTLRYRYSALVPPHRLHEKDRQLVRIIPPGWALLRRPPLDRRA